MQRAPRAAVLAPRPALPHHSANPPSHTDSPSSSAKPHCMNTTRNAHSLPGGGRGRASGWMVAVVLTAGDRPRATLPTSPLGPPKPPPTPQLTATKASSAAPPARPSRSQLASRARATAPRRQPPPHCRPLPSPPRPGARTLCPPSPCAGWWWGAGSREEGVRLACGGPPRVDWVGGDHLAPRVRETTRGLAATKAVTGTAMARQRRAQHAMRDGQPAPLAPHLVLRVPARLQRGWPTANTT